MPDRHEYTVFTPLLLDYHFYHDHAAVFIEGVFPLIDRFYPSILFSDLRVVSARQIESFNGFPHCCDRLQTSSADSFGMDQDKPVFTHALDRNVFIQQTNWKNDDPGQKSLSHHADPCHGHPCDLSVFHQRHVNDIDIDACPLNIALFSAVSCFQEEFYPQFNPDLTDYSCIAALKLRREGTHWRKGHKFAEIVIQ